MQAKPASTPPFSVTKPLHRFSTASVGGRYISYLIDLVVVGCITTLVLALFHISPILFEASFLYFQGVEKLTDLSSSDVMITLISFVAFAAIYFFAEAFLNLSVGKRLMGQHLVMLKGFYTPRRYFLGALERAIIKAVPPIAVIDGLFILKSRRLDQRLTDSHNGFVVVQKRKPSWWNFISMSAILYYFPLVTITLRSCFTFSSQPSSTPSNATAITGNLLSQIAVNNLGLSLQLLLGGITLSLLSVLIIFSSSLIEGILLGSILRDQSSFILHYVLPHFFFETAGYVLMVCGSVIISMLILDWIEGYIKKKSLKSLVDSLGEKSRNLLISSTIAAVLILLGAMIEASLA